MRQLLRDRTIPLAIAALALGTALQVNDGLYSPWAVALLGVAGVLASLAFWYTPERSRFTLPVLVAAISIQLGLLLADFPGSHHERHEWRDYGFFLALMLVAIAIVSRATRFHRSAFIALLAIYLLAGTWLVRITPTPYMDVFIFQRDACAALISGMNPYTITYPDLYGRDGAFVYGEGLARDGRLLFGFPYMPLTLWWNLLGYTIAGDYRFAQLIAVAVGAVMIAATTWSRVSVLAALILLFTPRGFFIVEQGWTEPVMVMLVAATVLCAVRFPHLLPYAFGFLLSSKQYMILLIPLAPLLVDWRDWRFHLKAIATACVVTLPLALANFSAFWNNVVILQFRQPFRDDALSFAAALSHLGLPKLFTAVPVVAALAVAILCARRMNRSPHSFAIAVAITFLTFFALNKQAFANYYFFVIASLCCAIASLKPSDPIVR
ncbi:MAG: hypothetical protein H7Z14_18545 [Anaerolineae bacterium]|nr:hypothetical protein [Phycisphaerae bacterium]